MSIFSKKEAIVEVSDIWKDWPTKVSEPSTAWWPPAAGLISIKIEDKDMVTEYGEVVYSCWYIYFLLEIQYIIRDT